MGHFLFSWHLLLMFSTNQSQETRIQYIHFRIFIAQHLQSQPHRNGQYYDMRQQLPKNGWNHCSSHLMTKKWSLFTCTKCYWEQPTELLSPCDLDLHPTVLAHVKLPHQNQNWKWVFKAAMLKKNVHFVPRHHNTTFRALGICAFISSKTMEMCQNCVSTPLTS